MSKKRSFIAGKLSIVIVLIVIILLMSSATVSAGSAGAPAEIKTSGSGVAIGNEWAHCSGGVAEPSKTWYMAEGCTAYGYETWILVLNYSEETAITALSFMTASSVEPVELDITMEPFSRATVNVADAVPGNYDVSTLVESDIPIVCERAMYAPDRNWAHSNAGVTDTATQWYLAEGCTAPGYETWVLVQNPGDSDTDITIELQTDEGAVPGPIDTIPPRSRRSYNLADYITTYNVSTLVNASSGVVCERATYASNRDWASSSGGATAPSTDWYLVEGCTAPGYETWVLVQNPGDSEVGITTELQTENGAVPGPMDTIPPQSRRSYNLADYIITYNVSTCIKSDGGVVCERAMYSPARDWAHSNAGTSELSPNWYFAEGCALDGFETWILLQNPTTEEIGGAYDFVSDPPYGYVEFWFSIKPQSRTTMNTNEPCPDDVQSISFFFISGQPFCAERAMYGISKNPMVTPTEGTPIYPFTRDESIACGHWPAGSLDYPYFGAPRNNGRLHAGIDIYPAVGAGAPVYAMKSGTVILAEPFYTRYTGEVTYGLMVDHGDFVVNYGEVQQPSLRAGDTVQCGQLIGYISGTRQLHLEMYTPGTTNWHPWYGAQPADLIDPTGLMLDLYDIQPQ